MKKHPREHQGSLVRKPENPRKSKERKLCNRDLFIESDPAKLDCGLDQSPTVMVVETTTTKTQ